MSEIAGLRAEIARAATVRPEHLLSVLAALERCEEFVEALRDRLLLVDELPAEAPFGALIRLRVGGLAVRAPLYLGNGPGQPLSKLVPVAV